MFTLIWNYLLELFLVIENLCCLWVIGEMLHDPSKWQQAQFSGRFLFVHCKNCQVLPMAYFGEFIFYWFLLKKIFSVCAIARKRFARYFVILKKFSTKFSRLNCTRKKFGMWNGRRHILTEVQIPVLPFVYTYEKTFQSYWLNSNPSHIRYTL